MSTHQQWIELDSIINDYISESEQSVHKYFKLFHIAFRGMEQLGLDAFYQVKSVELPISANGTVTLPADYQTYSKVGIFNGAGELAPLAYNSNLSNFADQNPQRLSRVQATSVLSSSYNGSPVYCNYWYDGGYRNIYGVPSGNFIGDFKIDNAAGVILLGNYNLTADNGSPAMGGYVVLEYVASPQPDQPYYVPVQFREAIIAWLAWRDIQNLPPSPRRGYVTDKAAKKKEFYNERRLAIGRYKPFRLSEAYQVHLEGQRMCVKV